MSDLSRLRDEPGCDGERAREILADERWAEPPPAAEAAVWAKLLVALPPGSLLPGAPPASGSVGGGATCGGSSVILASGGAANSGATAGTLGASAGVTTGSAGVLAKLAALGGATKVFVASTAITAGGIVGWGIARDALKSRATVVDAQGPQTSQVIRDGALEHGSVARGAKSEELASASRPGLGSPRSGSFLPDPGLPSSPESNASEQAMRGGEKANAKSASLDVTSGLNEESALLAAARGALRRGAIGDASRRLSQHEARFPTGRLMQERQALRIEVLWTAGSKVAARRQLEAYRRAYPGSPHSSRLGNMMASGSGTSLAK